MVKGSCVCGDWTYEFQGDPLFVGMCHCTSCQKLSGHNGNTFAVLLADKFKQLSGSDKTYTRTADSGNPMTSYACDKCSCFMWMKSETKPHITLIRTGTIDDADVLEKLVPSKELYCSNRPKCFAEYPDIAHADKME